jgi:hypothetical protein
MPLLGWKNNSLRTKQKAAKNSRETNNCPTSTLNSQKKMMKDHISKISAL